MKQVNKKEFEVVEFVICGQFRFVDEDNLQPDNETYDLIMAIKDGIRRWELNRYTRIGFCNCGMAEDSGPSICILPERVRYFDVDPENIPVLIERHVESVVTEAG